MKSCSDIRLRETKYAPVQLDRVSLDGTFSGYASVFNRVDMGNDIVLAGAFRRCLTRKRPGDVRMLFQHDPDEPIGVWLEMNEDKKGLWVRGRIATNVAKGAEVLELMRCGAIDGLSIGFKTVKARKDAKTRVRTILEAELWEISVVTFPMQEEARISSVKSNRRRHTTEQTRPSLREFEQWLTRDAGLTRREARTVIHKGYATLAGRRDAAANLDQELAADIRHAANQLSARSR